MEFEKEMTFKAIPNRLLCGKVLLIMFELGCKLIKVKICCIALE